MRRMLAAAMLAALCVAGPARADCISIDSARLPTPYNPFNASAGIDQTITLSVRRYPVILLDKPDEANIVFVRRAGDNYPYDIILVKDDGAGSGGSVLYSSPPTLSAGNNDNGEIDVDYGIILGSDVRYPQIRFTAPVNTDLPAGDIELAFDIKVLCESPTSLETISSGFKISLTVLSALQASYTGSALDFGEIGGMTTADINASGDAVKRRTGNIRVASSGPYKLEATSQNNWQLTKGGTPTANANERIAYQFSLAGRTAQTGSDYAPKACLRAGVAGEYVPVSALLLEGGVGKAASSTYQDVVTVTVTPLGATEAPGATTCR